jgi:hypothetical protein
MRRSEVRGAVNAICASAANDAIPAKQSEMLHSWQSNHYVTQMQQLEGHAVYAAMTHMQQYPLPDAVNATRGFGETICVFRVSVCCKTSNHCFGFVSSCFDVSSHETTLDKSVSLGCFNTVSTSLVCNKATNLLKSLPLKVSVFPVVFISCCESWIKAQSNPVIDSDRIHLAI